MNLIDRDKIEKELLDLINTYSSRMQSYEIKQATAGKEEAEHYAHMHYGEMCKRMGVREAFNDLSNIEDTEAISVNDLLAYQRETGDSVIEIIDWWMEKKR